MPNHITNRLVVNGPAEDVHKFFKFIKSDDPKRLNQDLDALIDFNKILPQPKTLDDVADSWSEEAEAYVMIHERGGKDPRLIPMGFNRYECVKNDPAELEKYLAKGRLRANNREKYQYADWWHWRVANWGTKWNAYNVCKHSDNSIEFRTAWNGVPSLMHQLCAHFPTLKVEYLYADEDWGYNVGHFDFHGSEIYDHNIQDNSAEAWEIVFELGVAEREDFIQQSDGSWEYKEDEE